MATYTGPGCGWGQCPGCGRERRLAGDGTVCAHNRWDSLSWSMTACEGSGRLPAPHPGDRRTGLAGLTGPGAW
jgi:hypothetical protein